ncbi:molybdate transport system permease protein [Campylobacter jejuni]|nr:molybdate transport system permease protein [Campylobacter jejuni]
MLDPAFLQTLYLTFKLAFITTFILFLSVYF